MKRKLIALSRQYIAALRKHLQQGPRASVQPALALGCRAEYLDLETLDVARIHEDALAALKISDARNGLMKQAEEFFTEVITPIEKTHTAAMNSNVRLSRLNAMLDRRTADLTASQRFLRQGIIQRKTEQRALQKSGAHSQKLLTESRRLERHLRRLTHQLLSAQEDKRKKLSRNLHDEIAQTLLGSHVRLLTLKKEAEVNAQGLRKEIVSTQRLVEKSVDIVHRFARELRPAVLNDLGLIPALHSFLKSFTARTGVRTRLTAFAGVEHLDATRRSVLFRVAQEALTNVARHARASWVELLIQKLPGRVRMRIKDDGKSFDVARALRASGGKHLGLLGMRERLEMVGGTFGLESTPGQSTIVEAQIPVRKARKR